MPVRYKWEHDPYRGTHKYGSREYLCYDKIYGMKLAVEFIKNILCGYKSQPTVFLFHLFAIYECVKLKPSVN